MTFLPIVERELRAASRRRALYWTRFAAALAAAGLCTWVMFALSYSPQEAGVKSFFALSGLAFIYSAGAGFHATCDCLSEEKREGTLGLLFLTDLRAYDIVLGKLAARSVNTFYALLAVIPVLAIPLLLGGVNSAEFWRAALVTVNLLFFSLALGMFASAVCRREQRAFTLAGLLAFLILIAAPVVVRLLGLQSTTDHRVWLMASPATACFAAFDTLYTAAGMKTYFWLTVLVTQFYAWGFLALACFLTPRSWQDRAAAAKEGRGGWMEGSAEQELAVRRTLLETNPFLWRSSRPEFKRILVWAALAMCLGGWIWLGRMVHADVFTDAATNAVFLVTVNLILKYWIALEAARAFAEDRRSGAFELLLSTPLSERSIIRGQDLALWRQFGGPVIAVLGIHIFLLVTTLAYTDYSGDDLRGLIALYLVLAASLAADALALSRWSMWLALSGRKAARAALLSLAWILVMPAALFVLVATLHGVIAPQAPSRGFAIFWWCALGIGADLFFTTSAHAKLAVGFREMVANAPTVRRVKPAAAP